MTYSWCYFAHLLFVTQFLCSFKLTLSQDDLEDESLTELIEDKDDSRLWLEEESPPWFIDLFFMTVITFVHLWYAYHFTDYALRNLHPRQEEEEDVCGLVLFCPFFFGGCDWFMFDFWIGYNHRVTK